MKQKNPKKLSAVDALLRKYRGREHGVYAKVCQKYAITPKPEWVPSKNDPPKPNNDKTAIKNKLKQMKKQMEKKKPQQPAKPKSSTKPQSKPKSNTEFKQKLVTKSKQVMKQNKPKYSSQNNLMRNKLAALKNKRLSKLKTKNNIRQPPKHMIEPSQNKKIINKKVIIQKGDESEDEYEDDFEVLFIGSYQSSDTFPYLYFYTGL